MQSLDSPLHSLTDYCFTVCEPVMKVQPKIVPNFLSCTKESYNIFGRRQRPSHLVNLPSLQSYQTDCVISLKRWKPVQESIFHRLPLLWNASQVKSIPQMTFSQFQTTVQPVKGEKGKTCIGKSLAVTNRSSPIGLDKIYRKQVGKRNCFNDLARFNERIYSEFRLIIN